MQQFVVEMLPGSYRYANRKVQKPLHPESVQMIMEQNFSTVLSMHKEQTARVLRLEQTTDEFLTEYRKKHILRKMRITIAKHIAKQRDTTKALVWDVNPDPGSLRSVSETVDALTPDLKHSESCDCVSCDRRRDDCISMQETYLMDVGQCPNSQQANQHMANLLGLRIWNHTVVNELVEQTEPNILCTPVANHATTNMDDLSIRSTTMLVPDTPATGATETVCVTLPRQASEIETEYFYSDALTDATITDDEAIRDRPIQCSEMLEVYAEGVHQEYDDPFETNAVKRARIVPTKLNYKK